MFAVLVMDIPFYLFRVKTNAVESFIMVHQTSLLITHFAANALDKIR
jgi:hypothetical protein